MREHDDAKSTDATGQPSQTTPLEAREKRPILERTVLVSSGPAWKHIALLAALAGVGLGFGAGALVFTPSRAVPAAAEHRSCAARAHKSEGHRPLLGHARAQRTLLGVTVSDAPSGGAVVQQIWPGTSAQAADVREDDVIIALDDDEHSPITSARDLVHAVRARRPGDTVKLTLHRGEETLVVEVTLGHG